MPRSIISADSHVTEPPGTYAERIDRRYQETAPRIARHARLGDVFVIHGIEAAFPIGHMAGAGKRAEEISTGGGRFEDLPRGGWDPDARLADQDRDGVAAEVLYPTVGLFLSAHPDHGYKKACLDAYNLWIAEYCAAHPERLIGVGQTAMRSVEEGITELCRIRALGLKGVMMPAHPALEDYDSRLYDPLYEAAVDLGLPLSFHVLTAEQDALPTRGPDLNHFLSLVRGCQDIVGMFVLGGVFERHPELRVVCAEADAGWAPHYLYRMDRAYERHRYWMPTGELSKMPSEYFRENVYLTFQDDWVAFQVRNLCNVRRLMWANDFPHADSTWPRSRELLARHTEGVSEQDKDLILHDNVAELYQLTV